MNKIVSGEVQNKVSNELSGTLSEDATNAVAKLTGDTAGALTASGVRGAENWAKEQDKQNQ